MICDDPLQLHGAVIYRPTFVCVSKNPHEFSASIITPLLQPCTITSGKQMGTKTKIRQESFFEKQNLLRFASSESELPPRGREGSILRVSRTRRRKIEGRRERRCESPESDAGKAGGHSPRLSYAQRENQPTKVAGDALRMYEVEGERRRVA